MCVSMSIYIYILKYWYIFISWKDASEEGECRNVTEKMVCYGLFLLSRDYLVLWATIVGNEYFMIIVY